MLFENQQDSKQVIFGDKQLAIPSPTKKDKKLQIFGIRVQIKQQGEEETPVWKLYPTQGRHLIPPPKTRGKKYFRRQASRIAEQLVCSIGTNVLWHV